MGACYDTGVIERGEAESAAETPNLRARAESFGALVRVENPPAIVAVDRVLAARLGVPHSPLWDGEPELSPRKFSGPVEVHLAVTQRCPAGCPGCYTGATPDAEHVPFAVLAARLDSLNRMGVFRVAFGGGEPMTHPDLPRLLEHGRALGLEITVTTSGIGLTAERAKGLGAAAQVNVSYDGLGETYRDVRGYDGEALALRAIEWLRAAGVPVGVNVVLARASFEGVLALADRLRGLGVVEMQLLRYKPGGRANLDYLAKRLTREQVLRVPELLRELVRRGGFAVRIDCSMVPFFSSDASVTAGSLTLFGVQGCEAGRALLTVDTGGGANPCSFWPAETRTAESRTGESSPMAEADPPSDWSNTPVLEACRDYPRTPPAPCDTCAIQSVCRGGCRVVSAQVSGNAFSPDPECPRVIALSATPSST